MTQRGKAPVAVLPELWDVELTVLARVQDGIEVETHTSCKEGFKGYSKRQMNLVLTGGGQNEPVGYELSDAKSLENRLDGPNAKTWPSTMKGKIVGKRFSGTWESKVPAEGVDLRGEFDYTRID